MYYDYPNDYNDIYELSIGENPSFSFTYYDQDNHVWITGMTTTLINNYLDINQTGYYYRTYNATDGLFYNVTFRIVFKVGNPQTGDRTPIEYVNYAYNNLDWRDQLSSYTVLDNGVTKTSAITYDAQGNPTTITNFNYNNLKYNHANLTYTGRQLDSITVYNNSLEYSQYIVATIMYKYNDNGYRTSKTINNQVINYTLSGNLVVYETDGVYEIVYSYDVDGSLISFNYDNNITDQNDGDEYFYIRDLLGNIVKLVDEDGNIIVEYSYDSYGNITSIDDTSAGDVISLINPYTYRGYRYDREINMYYLNSRYYNPEIGRFINADGLIGEVGNLQTHNMYAYCANNPVMFTDPSGEFAISLAILGLIIGAGIGATIGGIIAYNIAEGSGAKGWELFGWTALGVVGGGIIGGAIGYGVGTLITNATGIYGLSITKYYVLPIKQVTILGHKGYVAAATSVGAGYYQVGPKIYDKLVRINRAWSNNLTYINDAIKLGTQFEIIPNRVVDSGSALYYEIQYLLENVVPWIFGF